MPSSKTDTCSKITATWIKFSECPQTLNYTEEVNEQDPLAVWEDECRSLRMVSPVFFLAVAHIHM